jgi:hypothetical protein
MKILVDTSVFITLAEIDAVYLLNELDGEIIAYALHPTPEGVGFRAASAMR